MKLAVTFMGVVFISAAFAVVSASRPAPTFAAGNEPHVSSSATKATVTVHVDQTRAISPDLFGIFFEDINWGADGGLYAEMVQNRSFEYTSRDNKEWQPLTAWQAVHHAGFDATLTVESDDPLNASNPHYAVLRTGKIGAGMVNSGFDGFVLKKGETYDLSMYVKVISGNPRSLTVRLDNASGYVFATTTFTQLKGNWTKLSATLKSNADATDATFLILTNGPGAVGFDMVSLFPRRTFRNRRNGLRPDLAQTIADLKPKFMRFPGGCVAHGDGLDNMYRWKETIGPVEQRQAQPNIWRYHQTMGLGYFEYFQFCEDIGAKPLPVVPAGVCCQNSNVSVTGKWGEGQLGLPLAEMPAYVQEVLDLIEYANGPATSRWGAKRAAAGHPKPFNLEYLGIGNEDLISEVFRVRFKMISDAVREKHPEITVVGTVGPFPEGPDYEAGWKFANEQRLEMVDEHGYKSPEWYWQNLTRFDAYDRNKSKVYLGEFAAHDEKRANTLRSALAEAAYMTSLERNGDIVRLASYAPLLARQGHTRWRPDMIYFDRERVLRSANYYVQQLFSLNQGDAFLKNTLAGLSSAGDFAVSSVRDRRTGDIIIKVVNDNAAARPLHVELSGAKTVARKALKTVLTGEPSAVNSFDNPARIAPITTEITVDGQFDYEAPAHSLTVIRIKTH
jgi:alpha-L-arabinofuranosidase